MGAYWYENEYSAKYQPIGDKRWGLSIVGPSWSFRSVLEAQISPKIAPRRCPEGYQRGPRRVPGGSREGPGRVPGGSRRGSEPRLIKKLPRDVPNPFNSVDNIIGRASEALKMAS